MNESRLSRREWFGRATAPLVGGAALHRDQPRLFARDIGLQHVREDLGFVPSLAECLAELPLRPWMAGGGAGACRTECRRNRSADPVLFGARRSGSC